MSFDILASAAFSAQSFSSFGVRRIFFLGFERSSLDVRRVPSGDD